MTGGDYARKQGDNDNPPVIVCFASGGRHQLHVDFNTHDICGLKCSRFEVSTTNRLSLRCTEPISIKFHRCFSAHCLNPLQKRDRIEWFEDREI